MYEIKPSWHQYYMETELERRQQIWLSLAQRYPGEPVIGHMKRFFNLRHEKTGENGKLIDGFLWEVMNLPIVYDGRLLFVKGRQKQVRESLRKMGYYDDVEDEAVKTALYWEIRNTVRRYIECCQNPNYRKKMFGVVALDDDERKTQILKDCWKMSAGVAARAEMEEEMELFIKAVKDEYFTSDERAPRWFEEMSKEKA